MLKFKIQFQKADKYRNNISICRPDDNKATYEKLQDVNSKLEEKYANSGMPIYINEEHEFLTVRAVRNPKYAFKEKNTYELTVQFKYKKNNDDREYINCVLVKSKCVERHTEDHGEDVALEFSQ